MNRRVKKAIVFLSVIASITMATSYLFVKGYLSPLILATLQKLIAERVNAEVSIRGIEISLLPTTLVLKGVAVKLDGGRKLDLNLSELRAILNPIQAIAGSITVNSLVLKEPILRFSGETDDLKMLLDSGSIQKRVKPSLFKADIRTIRIDGGRIELEKSGKESLVLQYPLISIERDGVYGGSFEAHVKEGSISISPDVKSDFSDLGIEGAFDRKSIDIKKIALAVENGTLGGSVKISLIDGLRIEGHMGGDLPAEFAAKYIDGIPEVEGRAMFSADLGYNTGGFYLGADMSMKAGRIKSLPFTDMAAELYLRDGSMKINRLALKTLNGVAGLTGDIDLSSGQYAVKGDFDGLNIALMKKAKIGSKNGIRGSLSGKGNIKELSFTGEFSVETEGLFAAERGEWTPPLSIKGTVDAEEKKVVFNHVITSPGGLYGNIEGEITDLKEVDILINLSLEEMSRYSFLFIDSLSGGADVQGRLYGGLHRPSFAGGIDLKRAASGGYNAERISGSIEYTKGVIRTDGLEILGKSAKISLGGSVSLIPSSQDIDISIDIAGGDISDLVAMAGRDWQLSGNISGNFHLQGAAKAPSADGNFEVKRGNFFGESFDRLSVAGAYENDTFDLKSVQIKKGRGDAAISGRFNTRTGINLLADINGIEIADIGYLKRHGRFAGELSGSVQVKGTAETPSMTAEAVLKGGELYGEPLDTLNIEGDFSREVIRIDALNIEKGDGTLNISGTVEPEGKTELALVLKNLDLGDIKTAENRISGVGGSVSLNAMIEGESLLPAISGDMKITGLSRKDRDISTDLSADFAAIANIKNIEDSEGKFMIRNFGMLLPGNRFKSISPFAINYAEKRFSVARFSIEEEYGRIDAEGSIGISGDMRFSISGATDVRWFRKYLKAVDNVSGEVDFTAELNGSVRNPAIAVSMTGRNGMVRFKGFPYDLTGINTRLRLSPERLTVDSLEGELQGAVFTGGGFIQFEALIPITTDLYFDVGEVSLRYPVWLSSRARGRITLAGEGEDITLGGDIEVLKASYTEDMEFKKFLSGMAGKRISKREEKEEKKGLNFNIHFKADDNLIVKNNLADLELKGYLRLVGRPDNLSLIGELETLVGKASFRNREFLIQRGVFTFSDPEKIVPHFDIIAEAEIKNYKVNLATVGTPDRYSIELYSDPPLEEKEVVSLITFGFTGSDLKGRETEMTSLEAASLILQGELEDKVKEYFGFDRFSIDPYYSESAGSTEARLSVGKELSEDLTATYSRGISSLQEEEVELEYKIHENISLLGSWSSREERVGSFGGDVVLIYEFQ